MSSSPAVICFRVKKPILSKPFTVHYQQNTIKITKYHTVQNTIIITVIEARQGGGDITITEHYICMNGYYKITKIACAL